MASKKFTFDISYGALFCSLTCLLTVLYQQQDRWAHNTGYESFQRGPIDIDELYRQKFPPQKQETTAFDSSAYPVVEHDNIESCSDDADMSNGELSLRQALLTEDNFCHDNYPIVQLFDTSGLDPAIVASASPNRQKGDLNNSQCFKFSNIGANDMHCFGSLPTASHGNILDIIVFNSETNGHRPFVNNDNNNYPSKF